MSHDMDEPLRNINIVLLLLVGLIWASWIAAYSAAASTTDFFVVGASLIFLVLTLPYVAAVFTVVLLISSMRHRQHNSWFARILPWIALVALLAELYFILMTFI